MVRFKSLLQESLSQGQLLGSPSQDTFIVSILPCHWVHSTHEGQKKLFEKWLAGTYTVTRLPGPEPSGLLYISSDGEWRPQSCLWMKSVIIMRLPELSEPPADAFPGVHLPRQLVEVSGSLLIWSWSDYAAQYQFNTFCSPHSGCSLTLTAPSRPRWTYLLYLDLGPLAFICTLLESLEEKKISRCSSWMSQIVFSLYGRGGWVPRSTRILYVNHSWSD